MNLTPKEAAAKYRNLEYRGLGAWYTPDGECLDYEEVAALRHTLAEAYLEQNPADDEEAITPEWLASIGFDDVHGCMSIMAGENRVAFLRSVQEFFINSRGVYGITTRRDLRALLRGMGHKAKGNR